MIMAGRMMSSSLYNLNAGNTQGGSTLHDLNTAASRNGDLEGLTEVDRDTRPGDSLDQEEDSNSGVGMLPNTVSTALVVILVIKPTLYLRSAKMGVA
jgi:hypothetical protein